MPNIKSAKKRVKITETKALQNQIVRNTLKTYLKKFDTAVASGDKSAVQAAYVTAVKKLDQAVAKGVVHMNTAARKKSQMTRKVNAA